MDFMIEEHQKDIQKYSEQADTAEDPQVRQFAETTLPDLKKHLEKAKRVESDL